MKRANTTHMVWTDSAGRVRVAAAMLGETLRAIDNTPWCSAGTILAVFSDETNSWNLCGPAHKVVPVRHRPGRFDRIVANKLRAPSAGLSLVVEKGQLLGVKERPWYDRGQLLKTGRTLVHTKEEAEDRRCDYLAAYRDRLIATGLLIPKQESAS